MLQKVLKEATHAKHSQLETLMHVDNIMNGTLTLEWYQLILTINYKVHQILETLLFAALRPSIATAIDIPKRLKLPALIKDMEEAGLPVSVSLTTPLFDKMNDAYILGALYVLEGATLGGHVIHNRLMQNSNLMPLHFGYHYYGVYGDDLMPQWKLFCNVLNQQPIKNTDFAIKGASDMFDQYITIHNNLAAASCSPYTSN
jgi:heme oxygenase